MATCLVDRATTPLSSYSVAFSVSSPLPSLAKLLHPLASSSATPPSFSSFSSTASSSFSSSSLPSSAQALRSLTLTEEIDHDFDDVNVTRGTAGSGQVHSMMMHNDDVDDSAMMTSFFAPRLAAGTMKGMVIVWDIGRLLAQQQQHQEQRQHQQQQVPTFTCHSYVFVMSALPRS